MDGSNTSGMMLVGGFFALETPDPAIRASPAGGLLTFWGVNPHLLPTHARDSAGGAFGALVRSLSPHRIWLPGWICRPMAKGLPADRLHLYRVTPTLAPDPASLGDLAPGDLLLAVNPFGSAPGPDWAAFVGAHPDTLFVEDCAQAIDTGTPPWGDWRLYSPRKLMGIPEGGLLVPHSARARAIPLSAPTLAPEHGRRAARAAPMALRRDRPADNALWHPLHQQAEAMGDNADRPMAPAALALLSRIDPVQMIAARKVNFTHLARSLSGLTISGAQLLFPGLTDLPFAPFGLPVLLPAAHRDAILARLHARGIFPAVHWRDILSPSDWAEDHARAASIVTLPCDHRYGPTDMDRIAMALAHSFTAEIP